MIDAPQLVQTEAQRLARIHLTVPRSEIRSVMGPGIGEVTAAVKAQEIGPSGSDPAHWQTELHRQLLD